MIKTIFFILLSFVIQKNTFAANYEAQVIRSSFKNETIDGLKFSIAPAPVSILDKPTANAKYAVVLTGIFSKKNWSLTVEQQSLELRANDSNLTDDRTFSKRVGILKKKSQFTLIAFGPLGEAQKETITLDFTNWLEAENELELRKLPRHSFIPSLGFSYINYSQSDGSVFSSLNLTIKAAYNFIIIPPKFDIGVSSYFTALPLMLSQSVPNTNVRFLGINGRIGYAPIVTESWRFSIQAGVYYLTSFVTNNAFGFQNLMGPQIYPTLTKRIRKGAISGYFKFSPVSSSFQILDLSNREIAGGISYRYTFKNGQTWGLNVDVSFLNLNTQGVQVSTNSTSLSLGYIF